MMLLRVFFRLAVFAALLIPLHQNSYGQSGNLFNDSRISSIHVSLPADSLKMIYDSVLSDHYYIARFIYDDGEIRDTLENAGFRLRGNTSRYSAKKSFKISFNTYVPGRRYQGVKKINLNGEHNDPTMIREKLFYEMWGRSGFPLRRTSFVRLYVNGQYFGLYTLLEEMDKDWLGRNYPDKGGNLYKCTYPADLTWHGPDEQTYKDLENSTVTGGRVYELQTNEEEDNYTRLVELISTLHQTPDPVFIAEISVILNVDMYLKALALDVATGNWDSYGFNKNNYYLYDNPSTGRFDFITYDPDNTYGVDWFNIDWATRDCKHWVSDWYPLPLAHNLLAVPSFYEKYKRYLDTISATIIDPEMVFPRIDSIHSLIRQAAVEDIFRTLDYGYSVADFDNAFTMAIDDHTPWGLKPFLTKRAEMIRKQLYPASTGDELPGGMIRIWPNPAQTALSVDAGIPVNRVESVRVVWTGGERREIPYGDSETVMRISVDELPAGLYFIEIITDDGHRKASKFVRNP